MTVKTKGKVPLRICETAKKVLGRESIRWRKLGGVSNCYTVELSRGYRMISDKLDICLICNHDNYERCLNNVRKNGGFLWN